MWQHYAANISMIDEKVGQILETLEQKGMLENSLVIFTSDHGDCLGDHWLPYKWTMYEGVVHVPLLIRDYRGPGTPHTVQDLVSLMDLGPTLLQAAGCEIPNRLEGRTLSGLGKHGS